MFCFFFFDFLLVYLGSFLSEDSMESIIYLFYMVWFFVFGGFSFSMMEAPKGEYGVFVYMFMSGFGRCSIRCCDYIYVLMLDFFKGYLLCDLVGILGNLDVVFGSVDR